MTTTKTETTQADAALAAGWQARAASAATALSSQPKEAQTNDARDAARYRWLLNQESSSCEYFRWAMHRNPQEVDAYIDDQIGEKDAKAS